MSVKIDARAFHRRLKSLLGQWAAAGRNTNDAYYNKADALVVALGLSDDDVPAYQKTTALQTWLLGYEFTDTVILFTQEKVSFLTGQKKANLLQPLVSAGADAAGSVPIEIIVRQKEGSEANAQIDKILDMARQGKDNAKIGFVLKDTFTGVFFEAWNAALNAKTGIEKVDITLGISSLLTVKDEDEMKLVRNASRISSLVMQTVFIEKMVTVIDEEKQISHLELAEYTEGAMTGENADAKLKLPSDINNENMDSCYLPIVQSGGKYDLRPNAMPDENHLHFGVILCSLGGRYSSYCSNIGRTFMISPSDEQKKNYNFLVELQKYLLKSVIIDGVKLKEAYDKALAFVNKKLPELEQYFVKNIGFATGIEFRDSSYIINTKNQRVFKANMIVNLVIGFENIPNPQSTDEKTKTYSLMISDTIRVTKHDAEVLTDVSKKFDDIAFYIKGDEKEEDDSKALDPSLIIEKLGARDGHVTRSAAKNKNLDDEELPPDQQRKAHQKELARKLHQEGLARFAGGASGSVASERIAFKKYESYKSVESLPTQTTKIVVDLKHETVLFPIYGFAVPFHISTIKSATKNDDYLRINFVFPGQPGGKKDGPLPYDDPQANFVRSLTYKSTEGAALQEIARQITDLRKKITLREAQKKNMEDLIEQVPLMEIKAQAGKKIFALPDVYIRPSLEGKRVPGKLEIHQNGLRYKSVRGDIVDVLFANVKHLIFQPSPHELIVLIHMHLKNPVMIGKKKTKDVQFYREATEASADETGRKKYSSYDDEEYQSEQEESARRAAMDAEFQSFAEKVMDMSKSLEVEVPFRDLGFTANYERSNIFVQPTNECLVHLSEAPFLVITLSDIERVHLERVEFHLKNFDMVLIYKDYKQPVTHLNSIQMTDIESIRDWLDSMDIAYTEGPKSLQWSIIMKKINEDPKYFFEEEGGWSFLESGSDDEEEDEEDEESEYEPDDDDESESEDSYSDASAEESSGSEYSEEEDEEGEDWDELEDKARKADKKRTRGRDDSDGDDDDEDDRRSKKNKRK